MPYGRLASVPAVAEPETKASHITSPYLSACMLLFALLVFLCLHPFFHAWVVRKQTGVGEKKFPVLKLDFTASSNRFCYLQKG